MPRSASHAEHRSRAGSGLACLKLHLCLNRHGILSLVSAFPLSKAVSRTFAQCPHRTRHPKSPRDGKYCAEILRKPGTNLPWTPRNSHIAYLKPKLVFCFCFCFFKNQGLNPGPQHARQSSSTELPPQPFKAIC